MRTILAVGAYERDNFGDYLFLEVLARHLIHYRIIPGSVIAGDMMEPYGITTVPYDYILNNTTVDLVWTVGGEVGGVDVPGALTMSLSQKQREAYITSQPEKQIAIEQVYGANRKNLLAYIPDMSLYSDKNEHTPLIVNSVGISDINIENPHVVSLMKNVEDLSVRDNESKLRVEKTYKKEVNVAPDIVHTLPLVYEPERKKDVGVLVQYNEKYYNEVDSSQLMHAITEVAQNLKLPVTLLLAGTAFGHDSEEVYASLIKHLNEAEIPVRVIKERSPLLLVDYISSAAITISTSLHVRIISASYGIRRVSLENKKVTRYASEWDDIFPYNNTVDKIQEGVDRALGVPQRSVTAKNLTEAAYENLRRIKNLIPGADDDFTGEDIDMRRSPNINTSTGTVWGITSSMRAEVAENRSAITEAQLNKEHEKALYYEAQYSEIIKSKSWKLITQLRKIKAKLR